MGLITPTYQRGRVKYYLLADAEQSNSPEGHRAALRGRGRRGLHPLLRHAE
ncbi:MAG: hypothetical protein WKG07_13405 [Hymenobacter sp.]